MKIILIDKDVLVSNDVADKFEFYPGVFQYLSKIVTELDYKVALMVEEESNIGISNQRLISFFQNERIYFSEIIKYSAGNLEAKELLIKHLSTYKLQDSFILTNSNNLKTLANEIGCAQFQLGRTIGKNTLDWQSLYENLKITPRKATVTRNTSETKISVCVNLDGNEISNISTGLSFFNHMLEQISRHGNIDLTISVDGDLHIDEHHTIEDVGITLGEAFSQALGSKKGIERYGFLLPMDDCLAQVALDFGGRPWIVWEAEFKREKIGDVPTEMFMHFFKSFSDSARCNLNIKAEGGNEHHKIESIFKAFAKAIKMAVSKTNNYSIPSTKGSL